MTELWDSDFLLNFDWDPNYLQSIFDVDFYDTSDLWDNNIQESELVEAVEIVERYSPIVEDISIEDELLCSAVEQIEEE